MELYKLIRVLLVAICWQVLTSAGQHLRDDVIYSMCQLVANTSELHQYRYELQLYYC